MSTAARERFNQAAEHWDKKTMRVRLAEAITEAIRAEIPLHDGLHALDYGCGTGLLSLPLATQLGSLLGVDSAAHMLEVMRDKATAEGLSQVHTQLADFTHEELPEQRFDLIMSSMTLHHVADTAHLFHQFYQISNPGARLALADLDAEDGSFHKDNQAQGVIHFGFERAALAAQAEAAGFVEVRFVTAYSVHKEETGQDYPIFLLLARKP